jgi:hypothetical protein
VIGARVRGLALAGALVTLGLPALAGAGEAVNGEGEVELEDFFPLVTRRPALEREIELRVLYDKSRRGRETSTVLALDYLLLPRWQLELSVPVVFSDPRGGPALQGVGDVAVENKVVVTGPGESPAMAVGLELVLPSGSRDRGLGGHFTISPFVAGGLALGRTYLVAHLEYDWGISGPDRREQNVIASAAAGHRLRHLIPLVELSVSTQTREPTIREPGERRTLGRPLVTVTPGFNWEITRATTVGLGVQLPLTHAPAFDYRVLASLDWGF